MARSFNVPEFYRSAIIGPVKAARRATDPLKRDLAPSVLDFGPVRFKIGRHFGFCYGVENAIDIAYRAINEHPDKAANGQIYLLSEMIHNPHVNDDLQGRGIRFLRTTSGEQLIPFETLGPDDLVIIPAFGTTREIQAILAERGVDTKAFDTTCPFVTKVWKKSAQIARQDYTIVVHGKRYHEETRATFSHAEAGAPVVVVRNMEETERLAQVIRGEQDAAFFFAQFPDRYSEGFDPERDLVRIGVVNQTTMLATETQAIADYLKQAMVTRYGADAIDDHFADTSDTLCYATKENQDATKTLIAAGADLAIVVGGYNSSNTSHLAELAEEAMPTYFVKGPEELHGPDEIGHFHYATKTHHTTRDWLPTDLADRCGRPLDILLAAGASCPDALLDGVIRKVLGWFEDARTVDEVLAPFEADAAKAEEAEQQAKVQAKKPKKAPSKPTGTTAKLGKPAGPPGSRPPGARPPGAKPPAARPPGARPPGAKLPGPPPQARPPEAEETPRRRPTLPPRAA
ncbi:MAG: 4-hydroxy-3-methylbut-2-enyl diphosphate reductase [Bacteroidota bacterium]